MAQTNTYAALLSLIEARMGASFGTTEQSRIKDLVNARARDAALESDLWENLLVIGEERVVDDSATALVPYTGQVFDDTADVTDSNPYSGTVDTFLRVHAKKPWAGTDAKEYEFAGIGSGARLTGYRASYGLSKTADDASGYGTTVIITLSGDLLDCYVGGTIKLSNFATTIADINGTQTVTAVSYSAGSTSITIAAAAVGSWTLDGTETVEAPTAFCTYRKRISDITYGDGAGETADIPLEWFNYISYGVHADMLDADQQFASSARKEAQARFALQLQLERLDAQHAAQTVGQSIFTTLSEQGRD